MKFQFIILLLITNFTLNNQGFSQTDNKPSLCSDDILAKINNTQNVIDPLAYSQPGDNETETLKQKRMKIAGYSILSGMVGGGSFLAIWGGIKAKKAGEKFNENYFREKKYSNYLFTGVMATGIGLSASIPLIVRGHKKK
jgi:hypothetical protein